MRVTILRTREELELLLSEWQDLATDASEPNCFYEPWMVLPALNYLENDLEPFFLTITGSDEISGKEKLLGFFPLVRSWRHGGVPILHLKLWRYEHCYYCEPLVRNGFEESVAEAVVDWWLNNLSLPRLLVWNNVDIDSPFFQKLRVKMIAEELDIYEEIEERVLFEKHHSIAEYHERNFSKQLLKEIKRKKRRLSELGELEFHFKQPRSLNNAWLREFLELEAKGWKGKQQTAMKSSERDLGFMKVLFTEAISRGRLITASMRINKKLIASSLAICAGDGGYAFKIAYDEEYKKYSPALILEFEHIQSMHEEGNLQWLDTCVSRDSEMARRLGSGTRHITTLAMTERRFPEGMALHYLVPVMSGLKPLFRERR